MFRFIAVAGLAMLLFASGCSSLQTQKQSQFAGLPFRHKGFDFKEAWKVSQTPEGVKVEGVLKNLTNRKVENLEVKVTLLRNRDKVVAEQSYFVPGSLDDDEIRNFDVLLKNATLAKGDQLAFRLDYMVTGTSGYRWNSEFKADAASGAQIRKGEDAFSDD